MADTEVRLYIQEHCEGTFESAKTSSAGRFDLLALSRLVVLVLSRINFPCAFSLEATGKPFSARSMGPPLANST